MLEIGSEEFCGAFHNVNIASVRHSRSNFKQRLLRTSRCHFLGCRCNVSYLHVGQGKEVKLALPHSSGCDAHSSISELNTPANGCSEVLVLSRPQRLGLEAGFDGR
jgi:hypothetical protein